MKIQSQGQKIKYFRKLYKIKQKDLCTGIVSPAMLCYLENDKYELNKETAKMLTDRINSYIADENEKLSYEVLGSSIASEIDEFINEIKKNLESTDESTILILNGIFKNNGFLEKKIEIFVTIANYTIKNKLSLDSIYLLETVLIDSIEISCFKFLPIIILQLQRLYNSQGNYSKTVNLYYKTSGYLNQCKEIMGHVMFNFALGFHKLDEIEEALKLYKKANNFFQKEEKTLNCLINIGVCYSLNKMYVKELKIIESLQHFNLSPHKQAVNYSNLLICYINLDNEIGVKTTKLKLQEHLEKIPLEFRYQSYLCLGKAGLYLKDRYDAMINFENEIKLPVDLKHPQFFIKEYKTVILHLVEIYYVKDKFKFINLEKYILYIPKESVDSLFIVKIMEIYVKVYNNKEYSDFLSRIKKLLI